MNSWSCLTLLLVCVIDWQAKGLSRCHHTREAGSHRTQIVPSLVEATSTIRMTASNRRPRAGPYAASGPPVAMLRPHLMASNTDPTISTIP
jgi:hypothetical protein